MSRDRKRNTFSVGARLTAIVLVSVAAALIVGWPAETHGSGSVRFSDTFDRATASGCAIGKTNNALGGTETHYYIPINTAGASIDANTLRNNGADYGGVQFSAAANCNGAGQNVGADLNIRADILVPTDSASHVTEGGTYIRSRFASSGDGIIGGAPSDPSGGYWIQLRSNGETRLVDLRNNTTVAVSGTPPAFDATVFHSLEIAAQATSLQVSLDGQLVTFCQGNSPITDVAILTDTNLPGDTNPGNDGTAGIAFSAQDNRGAIGGQRADNLIVSSYASLLALPTNDTCGPPPGTITGHVMTPASDQGSANLPVNNAYVTVCRDDLTHCKPTNTNAAGEYSITGLGAASYLIQSFPPDGSALVPDEIGPVTLAQSATLDNQDLLMRQAKPPPPGTSITSNGTAGALPVVFWAQPITLTTTGCSGGEAAYTIANKQGTIAHGPMTEASPGVFTAEIPELKPSHGSAQVQLYTDCADSSPSAQAKISANCTDEDDDNDCDTSGADFDLYIDPSGLVKTSAGSPIAGATVTLYRSDTAAGSFQIVANGSGLMSPGNRTDPDTTDAGGHFGWDVMAGFYKIRAEKPGCTDPQNQQQAYVETDVLTIPPPRVDLLLTLNCSILGDADCNASVTIADVTAILRHLTSVALSSQCLAMADVNCDLVVDAKDALDDLRFLAQVPIVQPSKCRAIGT